MAALRRAGGGGSDLLLESIRVENIRGFDNMLMLLGEGNAVLVGPNNAGKTSVLRVLDWVFNSADAALLQGVRGLTPSERDLLVPARQTGGKARRITLAIRLKDGRTARRYSGIDHVVQVRLGLKASGVTAQVGAPRRGEGSSSADLGVELLALLQAAYSVEYVPPHRSASAEGFQELVRQDLLARARTALMQGQSGGRPTREQARLQQSADNASQITASQLKSFWADLEKWMPESLVATGDFEIPLERADLLKFLVDRAAERVATGVHDATGVRVRELGAGHQSLLWLALKLRDESSERRRLLLIEEPESFLHPSAQRQVARQLFDAKDRQVIMSTHSTVLVDESDAGTLRLVRGHKVFSLEAGNLTRLQISSALMTGRGSEVIFSSSVLLVEGPGDRLFFERLRRRLAGIVPAQVLGAMSVIEVGGKTQFGPWVHLLEGFANKTTGERPISWLVASDSGDAVADTLRGLNDAGITVPAEVRSPAGRIPQQATDGHMNDAAEVAARTTEANAAARATTPPFGLQFVPVDLEHAALSAAKASTAKRLAADFGASVNSATELMVFLGSKGGGAKPNDKGKAPWMRERLAATLPWGEVSMEIKHILWEWARMAAAQLDVTLPARPAELSEPVKRERNRRTAATARASASPEIGPILGVAEASALAAADPQLGVPARSVDADAEVASTNSELDERMRV